VSVFIKHIPCDSCGSRDNAGLYSDGHTYCFGCGYKTFPNISQRLAYQSIEPVQKGLLPLPFDSSIKIAPKPYEWITKTLTPAEIAHLRVLWSNSQQLLIFPFFESGELIGWQARNFSDSGPKYRIHGVKTKISKVYGSGDTLVFTEDVLSAVVVSRSTASRPLFGTSLNQDYVAGFQSYKLWLDKDKRTEALRQCNHYKQYGINISPIFTEKDPKSYSKVEVDTFLSLTV